MGQDSSGEGGVASIFCEKIINGQAPCIYGDGEQIRDFVYVKDVAKASNKSGIYNVCTNTKTTVNKLFGYINDLIGKDIKPVYGEEREGDIRNSYMTYAKIKNEIGWSPEYSIQNGLKETLKYYCDCK